MIDFFPFSFPFFRCASSNELPYSFTFSTFAALWLLTSVISLRNCIEDLIMMIIVPTVFPYFDILKSPIAIPATDARQTRTSKWFVQLEQYFLQPCMAIRQNMSRKIIAVTATSRAKYQGSLLSSVGGLKMLTKMRTRVRIIMRE